MSGDIFGCSLGDATGIKWVENKHAAKHCQIHKRVLHNKELFTPNVDSAKVDRSR